MAAAAGPAAAAPATVVNAVSHIAWPRSELLRPGDDPRAHWTQVLLTAGSVDTFKHPPGHALAGRLNETGAGNFKSWQMTTVDPDLAADTMALVGPGDNEEEKLQVQPFRVPDDAAPQWATWAAATAEQVRHHLSRKCAEAVTVSSMVQDMKADDFEPEEEELITWIDALVRKRGKVKSDVSLREFFGMVEDLLPDEEMLHEKIANDKHGPESLAGACRKFTASDRKSVALYRRKLLEQEEVLKAYALRKGIKKGKWWRIDDDEKTKEKVRRSGAMECMR